MIYSRTAGDPPYSTGRAAWLLPTPPPTIDAACAARRGGRLGRSAPRTEQDELRTLAAVCDTATQRADSAIWRLGHLTQHHFPRRPALSSREDRWSGYEYRNGASRRMRSALLAAACRSGWSQMWSHSPEFAGVRQDPSVTVSAGRGRWRTPVNAGQHCWKACWGQPLASSNLASSATSDQAIHQAGHGPVRLRSLICSLIHSTHIGVKRPKMQAHASECYRGCRRPLGVSALSD